MGMADCLGSGVFCTGVQIILELIEAKELPVARMLLRQSDPMFKVRESDPDRFLKLERAMSRTAFVPTEVLQ